jgi:hypothetical protein
MSNPAPSSHPGREPQPVNPYAASRHAAAQDQIDSSRDAVPPRPTFGVQMTWIDRQAFLRSVGPIRFGVLCSALLWIKQFVDLFRDWQVAEFDPRNAWNEEIYVVLALSIVVQGVFAFYLCWLDWRYADAIREMAGGTTASMRAWSGLSYRTSWVSAIWFGLAVATEMLRWFVAEVLSSRLFVD